MLDPKGAHIFALASLGDLQTIASVATQSRNFRTLQTSLHRTFVNGRPLDKVSACQRSFLKRKSPSELAGFCF